MALGGDRGRNPRGDTVPRPARHRALAGPGPGPRRPVQLRRRPRSHRHEPRSHHPPARPGRVPTRSTTGSRWPCWTSARTTSAPTARSRCRRRPPTSTSRSAQVPARLDEIRAQAAGRVLVVYCHHGVRSLHAPRWLSARGVAGEANLDGGIDAWSRAVDPASRATDRRRAAPPARSGGSRRAAARRRCPRRHVSMPRPTGRGPARPSRRPETRAGGKKFRPKAQGVGGRRRRPSRRAPAHRPPRSPGADPPSREGIPGVFCS